jgi:hypothetical protein
MKKEIILKLDHYEKTEIFRLVEEISMYHDGNSHLEEFNQAEHRALIKYIKELISKAYGMGEYDESIRGKKSQDE